VKWGSGERRVGKRSRERRGRRGGKTEKKREDERG
jgi:hypothetical protein